VSSFLYVLDYNSGAGCAYFSDSVGLGVVAESPSIGNSLDHDGVLW
jgi:hypothetical protein